MSREKGNKSEVCQILNIDQIKVTTELEPLIKKGGDSGGKSMSMVELPTCTICLEKLDSRSTGLIQIQCVEFLFLLSHSLTLRGKGLMSFEEWEYIET